MIDLTCISVTATPETALKKLAKAEIAVFNVKKNGSRLLFCVHDNNIKKVFAIFSHPCYNISIERKSRKNALINFALNRVGLFVGCALFLAAVVLSDSFIFKISVTGSGSYLKNEVLAIVRSAGVAAGSFYRGLDKPLVTSQIMALPQVTFCSVEKQGSVIIVDVQTDEENYSSLSCSPLKSDVSGTVVSIVAVCGTPMVSADSLVKGGDMLIAPYALAADGTTHECTVVGYARIEVKINYAYPAAEESEENAQAALSSALLYSEEELQSSYTVRHTAEGVVYDVEISFIHTLSVNME